MIKMKEIVGSIISTEDVQLKELEYTPVDLLDIANQAESLGKLVKKFAHTVSRDLDAKENRLVGKSTMWQNTQIERQTLGLSLTCLT